RSCTLWRRERIRSRPRRLKVRHGRISRNQVSLLRWHRLANLLAERALAAAVHAGKAPPTAAPRGKSERAREKAADRRPAHESRPPHPESPLTRSRQKSNCAELNIVPCT